VKHDFVIVGAGSAGCVLARRLTDGGAASVALLEAGPEADVLDARIPAAFRKLFKTERDWAYVTQPQTDAGGRCLYMPRGRMIGGCSSINAMLYLRGNRADYDGWAELSDPSWAYAEVLPYFKKSERQQRFRDDYHGQMGPMFVADQRSPRMLSEVFLEAAEKQGLPINDDFNGADQEGVGYFQVTQRHGQRESTATAFLAPARDRANLEVYTGAQAARIAIEGERAVAVECLDGRRFEASREVIVCAGAFGSPHLLMLSGIGDPDQLARHGIETRVASRGVGENLQDHLYATLVQHCRRDVTLDTAEAFPGVLRHLLSFFAFGRGPFTSPVAEAGGFLRSDPSLPAPDLQLHFAPVHFVEHAQIIPEGNGYSLAPTLLTPKSRGRVSLASADPASKPLVDPRFLSDPADVRTLRRGYEIARDILESEPLRPFKGGDYRPSRVLTDPDAIEGHVRRYADHIYHPVGTCRMGKDEEAVVDPELRLRGLEGLRVVDASIMPTIPRGNTNAPTIMIAEKAADMILGS